jgi:DNA polymerase sigma
MELLLVLDPLAPFKLCLQDMVDRNNDLGHKAFAWKHIKTTFEAMLGELEGYLSNPPHPEKSFMLSYIVDPNHWRIQEREKGEAYGARLLLRWSGGASKKTSRQWNPRLLRKVYTENGQDFPTQGRGLTPRVDS